MLVLTRKVGETIVIGDNIEITVSRIQSSSIRLQISAPQNIAIFRRELLQKGEKIGTARNLKRIGEGL